MQRERSFQPVVLAFAVCGLVQAEEAATPQALQALQAVYATSPQGYPAGAGFARPDTSVAFRWHGYRDGAIARHDGAHMAAHVDPYNPLEDAGVSADKSVRFSFVTEHATRGRNSLRVDVPASAVKNASARVQIQCVASPILDSYQKRRISAYWSHYRWLKADVHNPAHHDVRLQVCGVPLVIRPGRSTLAVKTADAVGQRGDYPVWFPTVPLEVTGPERDLTLFFDHFRMEQEAPALIRQKGRLYQFAVKGGQGESALVLWPGFTPIEKNALYSPERGFGWTKPATQRQYGGLSFRSTENGLVWCRCRNSDCPLRFDLPNGRYGVWLFAAPVHASAWVKGAQAIVNGRQQPLLDARTPQEVRALALAGEHWDYRPGACLWAELVRDTYFPRTKLLEAEVKDGQLLLELPATLALRGLVIFPEADREEALREIGRLEFLLAESWDVAHAWVKGGFAEQGRYIGYHAEMTHPETIPARLQALQLGDADFRRGFVLFQRGLTDTVYPDTIPTPAEKNLTKLAGFAAPGEAESLTLGVLPLAERRGLSIEVDALRAGDETIPASALDVRLARYHQKCMEYGHHNHCYNYQEHYLVRRAKLDLDPGCARRLYIDIAVPPQARPGVYQGQLRIRDAGGVLASVAMELEVLPIKLETPQAFFGIDNAGPVAGLRKYGINFIAADHDTAVQHGYQGYAIWPYNTVPPVFKGKRIGWNGFVAEKELLGRIIADGKAGKGPRGFYGGYVRDRKTDRPFLDNIVKELPGIDILGVTTPVYAFHGADYTHTGEPWATQIPTRGKPELLEQAAGSGKEFWFVDWLRHSKEQPARFTFGFWLWRLGARGRFSTFTSGGDYHYGTAKESFEWEPYYTLLGVVGGNACRALKPSLSEGDDVPARDLLLIREGIDDYRYIHTLDQLLRRAEAKKQEGPAVLAARQFRDELRADLSLDLTRYYESRTASYAENWFPVADNPWTHTRLQETRRLAAGHIMALQRLLPN